jgi:hypothetical protein
MVKVSIWLNVLHGCKTLDIGKREERQIGGTGNVVVEKSEKNNLAREDNKKTGWDIF